MQAGGALSVQDLASFRAHVREPLAIGYRGNQVYATPELTCGPTLAHALRLLQESLQPGPGGLQPRVDASEGMVVIGDVRLPAQTRETLRAHFDYEEARVQTFPMKFACPSVVLREGGMNSGGTEISHPWGDAVAQN